jgi:8-oxo-dGTP diphosphatase
MKPWEVPTSVLGAGGILLHKGHVLLVQVNYGRAKGQWMLPGGRVEKHERLEEAVLREVGEETGVDPAGLEVEGLLALRHRLLPEDRGADVYFLFALRFRDPQAELPRLSWPEEEIIEARFWPIEEAVRSPEVRPVSRVAIDLARAPGRPVYSVQPPAEGFLADDTFFAPGHR